MTPWVRRGSGAPGEGGQGGEAAAGSSSLYRFPQDLRATRLFPASLARRPPRTWKQQRPAPRCPPPLPSYLEADARRDDCRQHGRLPQRRVYLGPVDGEAGEAAEAAPVDRHDGAAVPDEEGVLRWEGRDRDAVPRLAGHRRGATHRERIEVSQPR